MWERNKRQKKRMGIAGRLRVMAPAISCLLFAALLTVHIFLPVANVSDQVALENEITAGTSPATPTVPIGGYGLTVGETLTRLSDEELAAWIADFKELGITWVRYDVNWHSIQFEGKNKYNWTKLDRVVDAVHGAGLKSQVMVAYTPPWARHERCKYSMRCRPANMPTFGHFVGEAVKRYSTKGIKVWEIWNEPNSFRYWPPHANVAEYTELLKAGGSAVHTYDRSATVLIGGLGGSSTMQPNEGLVPSAGFLRDIYGSGGKGYFDGVGIHPYSYPVLPSTNDAYSWEEIDRANSNLRAIMRANGDGYKPIWITEFGAPTTGPGKLAIRGTKDELGYDHVHEDLQARLLVDAATVHRSKTWSGPFIWYSYKDRGIARHNTENFFGLLRADGSRKPAYEAYRKLIQESGKQ
jgi:polysaccharide biosynthesis protein PslG